MAAKWRGASFLARANVIGAGQSGQQYFGRYRSPPARGWRFSPSFGAVTQSGVVVFRGVNHLTAEPPLRGHNRRAMPKPSLGNHPSINQRRLPMMTFNSCRSFCGAPSQSSPAANRLTCQGVVVGGSCEHARHPGARTSGGPGDGPPKVGHRISPDRELPRGGQWRTSVHVLAKSALSGRGGTRATPASN